MKILFIDNQSIQNSIRIGLLEQMAHHDVHLMSDFDKAMQFYSEQKPEMVIIDFTLPGGLDALKAITNIDPAQHVITISDSLDCSEILGCDYCITNYRKRRVLKHSGIHELLYLLENFSSMPCEYANKLGLPEGAEVLKNNEV